MEKVELTISAELEDGCLSAGPTMLLNGEDVRAMSFDKETIFTVGATVGTAMYMDEDVQRIMVFAVTGTLSKYGFKSLAEELADAFNEINEREEKEFMKKIEEKVIERINRMAKNN